MFIIYAFTILSEIIWKEFLKKQLFGQVFQPSSIQACEENQILVLEFAETLPLGSGTLSIDFEGILNDKMKGFYRR